MKYYDDYIESVERNNKEAINFTKVMILAEAAQRSVFKDYEVDDDYFDDWFQSVIDNYDKEEAKLDNKEIFNLYYAWMEDGVISEIGIERKNNEDLIVKYKDSILLEKKSIEIEM